MKGLISLCKGASARSSCIGVILAGVTLAVAFMLAPRAAAQVIGFPSSANVYFNVAGQLTQTDQTTKTYGQTKSASTSNPLANPIQASGSFSESIAAGASAVVNANAAASSGLLRAGVDGMLTAAWDVGQASESRLIEARAQVGWTDYILVQGNPANPQPGRPLVVQAVLNLGGQLDVTPTVSPTFPSFSGTFGTTKVRLTGRDGAGRDILAAPPFLYAGDYGVEVEGSGNYAGDSYARPVIPAIVVTMQLLEGQPAFMSYMMEVYAVGSASATPYFAAGSTAVSMESNFMHTLTWGGIASVTDAATGQAVDGWSVASASGVNYAVPVPEPAFTTLLTLIFPALLARRP